MARKGTDKPRNAVITSFLSKTKDRFHEYNEQLSLEERLELAASIPGVGGVEIVHPYEVYDEKRTAQLLSDNGLGVAAVNVNIKAEAEFRHGSLTSPDSAVRGRAVEMIARGKEFAAAIGADKVTVCPLGDGHEFSFQVDYRDHWSRMAEAVADAADRSPRMPLFLEYKPSETRGRCILSTAARTLALCTEIGDETLGVTLDFGHSVYGGENPSEALALLEHAKCPYYIHINDNNGRWDWDFMVGSHHLIEYMEFLFYLKKYGYDDYLTSDTSPTRWDIRGTFEANARITERIWKLIDSIGMEALQAKIDSGDYLATLRFFEELLLGRDGATP